MDTVLKNIKAIFYVLLLASFAMWFGGFGFYASFVVPTGNEVLGSFEQATVTRQVTVPLNWLGVLFVVLALVDVMIRSGKQKLRKRTSLIAPVGLMIAAQVVLFWLHPQIDALVDLDAAEVSGDYDRFYLLHRMYLWAITVQWLGAWVWLIGFAIHATNGVKQPSVEGAR